MLLFAAGAAGMSGQVLAQKSASSGPTYETGISFLDEPYYSLRVESGPNGGGRAWFGFQSVDSGVEGVGSANLTVYWTKNNLRSATLNANLLAYDYDITYDDLDATVVYGAEHVVSIDVTFTGTGVIRKYRTF